MNKRTLNKLYLEDLSEYLVNVNTKRPHFHKNLSRAILTAKERYEDGDALALHDALLYCEQGCLPMPIWLSKALRNAVINSLTGGQKGSKGRSNSPLGNATKRLKREVHYRLVLQCQQIARQLKNERMVAQIITKGQKEVLGSIEHVFPPAFWEKITNPDFNVNVSDFKDTLDSQYSVVSKMLRGTFARAESRTIRTSYKAMEREVKKHYDEPPKMFSDIASSEPETLEALGLQFDLSELEMSAWTTNQEFVPAGQRSDEIESLFNVASET